MKRRGIAPLLALFLPCLLLATGTAVFADASFQADRILPSVCTVETENVFGSGLVVTAEGHVLTNAHVLDDRKTATIRIGDDTFEGTLLRLDEDLDLAVLETDLLDAPPASFAESEDILVGMDAYAVGSPEGLPQTITKGIVSVVGQPIDGQIFIQTDAATTYGNSGGPLCASDGTVLGLLTFTMGYDDGLAFAIPNHELLSFLHSAGLLLDRNVSAIEGIQGLPGYYDGTEEEDDFFDDPMSEPYFDAFIVVFLLVTALFLLAPYAIVLVQGLVILALIVLVAVVLLKKAPERSP